MTTTYCAWCRAKLSSLPNRMERLEAARVHVATCKKSPMYELVEAAAALNACKIGDANEITPEFVAAIRQFTTAFANLKKRLT